MPAGWARSRERLLAHLDPDGVEPREQRAQRLRGFSLIRHPDGSATPTGLLTPATTAVWQPILDALSAPHTDRDTDSTTTATRRRRRGGAAERDDRSAAQRRHDALLDAGLRLLRSATLPDSGGVPVTILARIDAHQLQGQLHDAGAGPDTRPGVAVTGTGDLLPDQSTAPAGLRGRHHPRRAQPPPAPSSATAAPAAWPVLAQRHALALRDGGCSFPGCTRPATWCQTHHITAWQHGGTTDLDNLCLLCALPPPRIPSPRLAGPHAATASRNGSHPPGSTPTETPTQHRPPPTRHRLRRRTRRLDTPARLPTLSRGSGCSQP